MEDLREPLTPEGFEIPPPGDYSKWSPLRHPANSEGQSVILAHLTDVLGLKDVSKSDAKVQLDKWITDNSVYDYYNVSPGAIDQWSLKLMQIHFDARFRTLVQREFLRQMIERETLVVQELRICEEDDAVKLR
jgi:hypothetical protein